MKPVFYPSNRKIYSPGLLIGGNITTISRAEVEDDGNIRLHTVEYKSGIPRTITTLEAALRWLVTNMKYLYSLYPRYKDQCRIFEQIANDLGITDPRFIRYEFTGYEPLLLVQRGEKSALCLRSISINDGEVYYEFITAPSDLVVQIGSNEAMAWMWASDSLRSAALKQRNPDEFMRAVLDNLTKN